MWKKTEALRAAVQQGAEQALGLAWAGTVCVPTSHLEAVFARGHQGEFPEQCCLGEGGESLNLD